MAASINLFSTNGSPSTASPSESARDPHTPVSESYEIEDEVFHLQNAFQIVCDRLAEAQRQLNIVTTEINNRTLQRGEQRLRKAQSASERNKWQKRLETVEGEIEALLVEHPFNLQSSEYDELIERCDLLHGLLSMEQVQHNTCARLEKTLDVEISTLLKQEAFLQAKVQEMRIDAISLTSVEPLDSIAVQALEQRKKAHKGMSY